jgi:hypothetical protein
MFDRFMQGGFAKTRLTASAKELNSSHTGLSVTGNSELDQTDSPESAKLSSFEEIYQKSVIKATASTPPSAWNILKVAEMANNCHLQGLSPAAKHSALMMALEAAGVAVEDMLRDAAQRQRVLNEYEDSQRRRLEALQTAKHHEKERLAAEMEAMCAQYRMRIAAAGQEVERERDLFREWQERKETEHRRISEAASACAPNGGRLMLEETSGNIAEKSGEERDDKSRLPLSSLSEAKRQPIANGASLEETALPGNMNLLSPPVNERRTDTVGAPRQGNGRRN